MTSKGFLEYKRQKVAYRPIDQRVGDFKEIEVPLTPEAIAQQAERCADCGIPFCHGAGCPVSNRIPEFNEFVALGRWQDACDNLHSTNNFPEITGRVCPAPCETACTLAVNDEPVLIRHIEYQVVERGFVEGWIKPLRAATQSGKTVAVIGSGPAGLAAAQQLARAGHAVTLFEKDAQPGGLLRYGIPDFKLEKWVIERRLEQMKAEGVEFKCNCKVGTDITAEQLQKDYDIVVLTMGAGQPRDLQAEGRDAKGIHFAMEFLGQQNRLVAAERLEGEPITAKDKHVIVIGGGDTGSDCVGTSRRQGAASIHQLEILPKPPESRPDDTPWPMWPRVMRTSSSHEEGCERMWSVMTKKLVSDDAGNVTELQACQVEWTEENGQWKLNEVAGSEFTLKADLVLLAMGFVHVEHGPLVEGLGLELDGRGNIVADNFQTTNPKVFAAGDAVSGASLIVRAIDAGRKAAEAVDQYLKQ
ncbi:MAG: glutamate synthase subunit beta [Planctomycetota bacterium]|jgi:glutamate synthase (NADPH/NADH) small chain